MVLPNFTEISSSTQVPHLQLVIPVSISSHYLTLNIPLRPTVGLYDLCTSSVSAMSICLMDWNRLWMNIVILFFRFDQGPRCKCYSRGCQINRQREKPVARTYTIFRGWILQIQLSKPTDMEIIAKHKPFKITGEDFANSNPMFAFYFYKYYISVIKPIFEEAKDPSQKAELEAEVKEAFKRMNFLGNQSQIDPSDEINMKLMLQYTQLMFAKNDHFHQQEGMYTKQIAEDYLTIYRLYEVVKRFGSLDQGQDKRRIYSKKKFIDIMKEIKKNPAIQQSKHSVINQSVKKSQLPPPPPVFKEEAKKIEKIEDQIKKSQFKPLPKPSNVISFDKIQMQIEANRALENAVSELSFDRFKHARDEVLHALELLDQMID